MNKWAFSTKPLDLVELMLQPAHHFNNGFNDWFRLSWEEGTLNFNDNFDRQCNLVIALASTRGACED